MIKKSIFISVILLALGVTDASAQGFFKELGKRLEKSLNSSPAKKTSSQSRVPSAQTAQQQQTPPWKTYVMVPEVHTAFLEPIGSPSATGKLGGKHISPIRKESEVKAWVNAQIGVEFYDNQRLIAEHEEYYKAVREEGNGWEGVHVRNMNLSDEVKKRTGILSEFYNNLKGLQKGDREPGYYLDRLAGTISGEYYKRTLNSSVAALIPYLSEEVAAYYKSYGNPDSLHLETKTVWYPYAGIEYLKTSIENQEAFVNLEGRVEIGGVNYRLYPASAHGPAYAVVENCDKYKVEGTDVLVPSYIIRDGITYTVTELRNWAFSGSGMKSIQLPNTIKKIGMSAFASLSNVTSITIPNGVKEIDSHCFENSPLLEEVHIPESVTKMGAGGFYKCGKLKNISMPEHLKSIDHYKL